MQIGIECFEDIEICSMIANGGKIGNCELTGTSNVLVYDTEDVDDSLNLSAYLSELLDVYTPKSELPLNFPTDNLSYIEDVLVNDWSVFKISKEKVKIAVVEICKNIYSKDALIYNEKVGIGKLCDSDFLKRSCLMKESTWERFMSSIKNINRFHSNHINLDLLKELFNSPRMHYSIEKGQTNFYRARISSEKGLKISEMGPPPLDKVTAGRANSQGIRCLYLANDQNTTFHEIRARDLDYVAVGKFKSNQKLTIVDLANLDKISPFSAGTFEFEWFAINMKILKKISKEIAKPLRRQDSELDYLPAQYIADFVKSLGFDGICYRSTLNTSGINYAIFDCKKFSCISVSLIHVDSLTYETKELDIKPYKSK